MAGKLGTVIASDDWSAVKMQFICNPRNVFPFFEEAISDIMYLIHCKHLLSSLFFSQIQGYRIRLVPAMDYLHY